MNSPHQQRGVSDLRQRRWGRNSNCETSGSDLELSLRSGSINTSTTETACETSTSSSASARRAPGPLRRAAASSEQANYDSYQSGSRAASPMLSPCPSPSPRSPRSPRSPCHSPGQQTPTCPSPSAMRYSSRRRSGVGAGGNLARLASRRSSRDSEAGEPSPLHCVRNQQRRTSNFLEIPGEYARQFVENSTDHFERSPEIDNSEPSSFPLKMQMNPSPPPRRIESIHRFPV